MAIANYPTIARLFKEKDYNVRVTVINAYGSFKEALRDSIGGGIIHSEDHYRGTIEYLNVGHEGLHKVYFCEKGTELVEKILFNCYKTVGVRVNITSQSKGPVGEKKDVNRTWIVYIKKA